VMPTVPSPRSRPVRRGSRRDGGRSRGARRGRRDPERLREPARAGGAGARPRGPCARASPRARSLERTQGRQRPAVGLAHGVCAPVHRTAVRTDARRVEHRRVPRRPTAVEGGSRVVRRVGLGLDHDPRRRRRAALPDELSRDSRTSRSGTRGRGRSKSCSVSAERAVEASSRRARRPRSPRSTFLPPLRRRGARQGRGAVEERRSRPRAHVVEDRALGAGRRAASIPPPRPASASVAALVADEGSSAYTLSAGRTSSRGRYARCGHLR
jgi:hypothetical protein